MPRENVPGWGVDRAPEQRPGVPMEHAPQPAGAAHWREPERQPETPRTRKLTKRYGLKRQTAVYSTQLPPSGLSGFFRRRAYTHPDHSPAHWLELMFADRVAVWEARVGKLLKGVFAIGGLFLVGRWLARKVA